MMERNPYEPCPYVCNNKSYSGWCNSTVCINPKYNESNIKITISKEDYDRMMMKKDDDYGCGIHA